MALEEVQERCCNQCLFTKNKIVSDERRAEILEDCEKNNSHFMCHKATIKGLNVTCHAFYKQKTNPQISALFESMGQVDFVNID